MGTTQARARLGRWFGDPLSAAVLLLVMAWTPVVVGALLGKISVPLVALGLLPLALIGLLIVRRAESPPAFRLGAAWAAILGGAVVCILALEQEPYALLVAPGLLVSAVACSRYPAEAVIAVFVLTGAHGSLTALTPFPVGETVDVVLAGLWLGTIWGYLFGARERPVWVWPGVVAVGGYVALSAFEVLAAGDRTAAAFSFRASAWYIAALLLVAFAPWPDGARMRIAKGVVLTVLVVGVYAVIRLVIGPSGAEQELALSRTGNPDFAEFVGSFTSNKSLAAWMAEVIPFCLAFALVVRSRWRLLAAGGCLLSAIALFGADTRLQIVAVAGGIAVVLALHQVARGLVGLRLGATTAAVGAILVVSIGGFGVVTGFSEESTEDFTALLSPTEENSVQQRLHTWESVFEDIEGRPFGRGLGSAGTVEQRFGRFATIGATSLDSGYLKVAIEQGLAVMVFYVLSLVALLYGLARRAIVTLDPERAALAIGGAGALTSLLVLSAGGLFNDGFTALAVWIMVGVGLAGFAFRGPEEPSAADTSGGRRSG